MKPIITNITKLTLAIAATFLVNEIPVSQAATEEANLDSLCNKFPLNSGCQDYDYSLGEPEQTTLEFERESFCTRFPQNSYCLEV